jgi:hypothetical protein
MSHKITEGTIPVSNPSLWVQEANRLCEKLTGHVLADQLEHVEAGTTDSEEDACIFGPACIPVL